MNRAHLIALGIAVWLLVTVLLYMSAGCSVDAPC